MKNKSKITDIYVLALTICLSDRCPQNHRKPLLRLLESANHRREENFMLLMVSRDYRQTFSVSEPHFYLSLGLTYNKLRYSVPISDICIALDNEPFGEESLRNLSNYYTILEQFHMIIADAKGLIDTSDLRHRWILEFENISRTHFHSFIKWSFNEMLTRNAGTDFLFTEDFEYTSKVGKTNEERSEMEKQEIITKTPSLPNGNPFNIGFQCQPFTYANIKLWQYFTKFDIYLSELRNYTQIKFRFYQELDQLAQQLSSVPNFTANSVQILQLPQILEPFRQHFLTLFKLKIYFYSFGIQKYILKSLKRHFKYRNTEMCSKLTYIWSNTHIETIYPNHSVFKSQTSQMRERIEAFYVKYWREADYETNPNLPLNQTINSLINEYLKLRFFQQNDGINKRKFRSVLTNFSFGLNRIILSCDSVINDHIKPFHTIVETQYRTNELHFTITETLIYWLVCGSCFMLFRQTASFISFMDEVNQSGGQRKQFFLTKAGIVDIGKTKGVANKIIDSLRDMFITFDDIYEKITNTLEDSKILLKALYKDYYRIQADYWFKEIINMHAVVVSDSDLAIRLHMISGLSFLMTFINDFRFECFIFRIKLQKIRDRIAYTSTSIAFNSNWDLCMDWIDVRRDELDFKLPFVCQFWTNRLNNYLSQFTQTQQIQTQLAQWILDADNL